MPSKPLIGKDAVIVTLAMQRKQAMEAQAKAITDNAQQQFAVDVSLVAKDLALPDDTQLAFHVERGQVTASWPDIDQTAAGLLTVPHTDHGEGPE